LRGARYVIIITIIFITIINININVVIIINIIIASIIIIIASISSILIIFILQGAGGRTHLVSPIMAAAAAVTGTLTDVRKLELFNIPVPARDASGATGELHRFMYAQSVDSAGPVIREGTYT
jgi:hypothetical protein